jgi:hypothetical protein
MREKIKHTFATYKHKDGPCCDVDEVAEIIVKNGWGDCPQKLNDCRAMEIYLMAKRYLYMTKKLEEMGYKE